MIVEYLEHFRETCGGKWETKNGMLMCSDCPMMHPQTERTLMLAKSEYQAGIILDQLAKAGDHKLWIERNKENE
jgi:hypothetical protein